MRISQSHQEARHSGSLTHLDSGTANARIRIYDGTPPITGVITSTMLVEIKLDKPSGIVSNGTLILAASTIALVSNSGVASWARVVTGMGDVAFDLTVSDNAGTGDLKLLSTTLYKGGKAVLLSAILS